MHFKITFVALGKFKHLNDANNLTKFTFSILKF